MIRAVQTSAHNAQLGFNLPHAIVIAMLTPRYVLRDISKITAWYNVRNVLPGFTAILVMIKQNVLSALLVKRARQEFEIRIVMAFPPSG